MKEVKVKGGPMGGRLFFLILALVLLWTTMGQSGDVQQLLQKADQAYNQRFKLPDTGHYLTELNRYRPWLERAITLYEKAWKLRDQLDNQSQAHIANRLAQLNYELTFYLNPKTQQEQIELLLRQGKEYGLKSLRLNLWFKSWEGDDIKKALSFVNDVEALLWTAHCWGAWLQYHPMQGMVNIRKVKAMYERAIEIDESYWSGSAHNALGALLIITPDFLGGNDKKGKKHLQKALTIAPDYLINHTVYAEYWGFTYNIFGNKAGIRDRKLIKRELNFVLQAPVGKKHPFWNRQAKKNAKFLLAELARLSQS